MANTPRPTTARRSVLSGAGLVPHGDSHDVNGVDPVLNQVIYHGSSTLSGDYTLTNNYADTGMTLAVNSRGGQLMILMSSSFRLAQYSGVALDAVQLIIQTRAVVGATALQPYIESVSTGFSSAIQEYFHMQQCGALEWLTEQLPGTYTVKIQAAYGGETTSGQIDTGTTMQVFELLPLRQG